LGGESAKGGPRFGDFARYRIGKGRSYSRRS
jgi:hypothetical protein